MNEIGPYMLAALLAIMGVALLHKGIISLVAAWRRRRK